MIASVKFLLQFRIKIKILKVTDPTGIYDVLGKINKAKCM